MVASSVIVLTPCGICRDEDDAKDMVVTTCGHTFHSGCVKEWDKTQRQTGRTPRCSYCNIQYPTHSDDYYNSYSSSSLIKYYPLHALSIQQVLVIEEGQPDPEKELITAQETLKTTQALLKQESDKTQQLQEDLTKLRLEKESESKAHAHRVSSILGELKAEKQLRTKALNIHTEQKQQMQKRIDGANTFIETLKAERKNSDNEKHRLQKKLDAQYTFIDKLKSERRDVDVNLHRIKIANYQQSKMNEALHLHIADLNREKAGLQVIVNQMKRVSTDADHRSTLQDLSGGFQRLEAEYLALRGLFDRKLKEASTSESSLDPMIHTLPINPILLQLPSYHSQIQQPIKPVIMESYKNQQIPIHPILIRAPENRQPQTNPIVNKSLDNGHHATNLNGPLGNSQQLIKPMVTPLEDRKHPAILRIDQALEDRQQTINPIIHKASQDGQHFTNHTINKPFVKGENPANPLVHKPFKDGSSRSEHRNNKGISLEPFEPSNKGKSKKFTKSQDSIVTKGNHIYKFKSDSGNKTSNPTNNQKPEENGDTKHKTNITSEKHGSSIENPIIIPSEGKMKCQTSKKKSFDSSTSKPRKQIETQSFTENKANVEQVSVPVKIQSIVDPVEVESIPEKKTNEEILRNELLGFVF